MAYHSRNHDKFVDKVINVYKMFKESDRPDTFIVKHEFPRFGIHISYTTWVNYKRRMKKQMEAEKENKLS